MKLSDILDQLGVILDSQAAQPPALHHEVTCDDNIVSAVVDEDDKVKLST